MAQAITGIDHGVILVKHLDRAAETYRRLGFALTPRGRHSEHMGTGNYCLMFEQDYLELLGVLQPTPANEAWRRTLQDGEGLKALALASDDAKAASRQFKDAGLEASEPLEFSRPVDSGGVKGDAAFRIVRVAPETVPGLDFFVCQHFTRQLVWIPAYQTHPNGATGLFGVTISAINAITAAEIAARLFGSAARKGSVVDTGRGRLRFVKHATLAALFPDTEFPSLPPFAAALHIKVRDLEQTARVLANNGVPYRRGVEQEILIAPADACGVLISFQTQPF